MSVEVKSSGGISAKVIADSIGENPDGRSIVTVQLRYPRFIHSELMTHRVFSRNASSSRAIPVAKMIEQVRNDPAMPIHWGKNQSGMQASEEHDALVEWGCFEQISASGEDTLFKGVDLKLTPQEAWVQAAWRAAEMAEAMADAGYHKQVVNRLLEPFQFMNTIVTATEWENFFELRCHPDAQPEIQHLARCIRQALAESEPEVLAHGQWHLPYVLDAEKGEYPLEDLIKFSAARCARVSYLSHDGKAPSPEKDRELFDRLVGSSPIHASPIEHQATPDIFAPGNSIQMARWKHEAHHGNFKGWVQFRKLWERHRSFDAISSILRAR